MLKLVNIKKTYASRIILDIPAATISAGLCWLKGANGTGKSTLMKIIAGMIPFDGEVLVHDSSLRQQPVAYRRLVSYVEAEPLYPPFVRGIDLIDFFAKTREARPQQVDDLADRFGIKSYIQNPVSTYSSGMVKKLSLVLAFIGETKLLLLDEPLVTIDAETLAIFYDLLRDELGRGKQVIVASHQELDTLKLPAYAELSISANDLAIR